MPTQATSSELWDQFVHHVLATGEAVFTQAVPAHLDPTAHLHELIGLHVGQHEGELWHGFSTDDPAHPAPGTTRFWRARVFDSDNQALLCPSQLGAPPCGVASPGRANRAGVSVFYAADSVQTAVAEVHPPVGSYVAVSSWIPRPNPDKPSGVATWIGPDGICVLDTTVSVVSTPWAAFYNALGHRLQLPIDGDTDGYIPTQYAVECIRNWINPDADSPVGRIHGLWYPSAATEGQGRNLVVFDPCRLAMVTQSATWFPHGQVVSEPSEGDVPYVDHIDLADGE